MGSLVVLSLFLADLTKGCYSDLECITWSLPFPGSEGRGRSSRVKILPGELFNPGAYIARPARGSEGAWCMLSLSFSGLGGVLTFYFAVKKRCAAFQSTCWSARGVVVGEGADVVRWVKRHGINSLRPRYQTAVLMENLQRML